MIHSVEMNQARFDTVRINQTSFDLMVPLKVRTQMSEFAVASGVTSDIERLY